MRRHDLWSPGVFANDAGAYDHLRVCSAEIGAKTLRRLHAVGVAEALRRRAFRVQVPGR